MTRLSVVRGAFPALLLALGGCATTGSGTNDGGDPLASMMRVHRTPPAVTVSGTLGSETNPVRVHMPDGEREYLYRLRCQDGTQPTFERSGSVGIGPYDKVMDLYDVACGQTHAKVYMDMYHCVEETDPVPGFTIVPEIGRRAKAGCD